MGAVSRRCPAAGSIGGPLEGYRRLLEQGDSLAAQRWCDWEETVAGLGRQPRYDDPSFRMAFARIVTHYFANHAWLENGALLCRANRLQGIPGVLIHGRLDISSPLSTAWELAKVWPDAELLVIDSDGHGGESMTTRLVEVTDRFRTA